MAGGRPTLFTAQKPITDEQKPKTGNPQNAQLKKHHPQGNLFSPPVPRKKTNRTFECMVHLSAKL